jgi:hypothetical protein
MPNPECGPFARAQPRVCQTTNSQVPLGSIDKINGNNASHGWVAPKALAGHLDELVDSSWKPLSEKDVKLTFNGYFLLPWFTFEYPARRSATLWLKSIPYFASI